MTDVHCVELSEMETSRHMTLWPLGVAPAATNFWRGIVIDRCAI